MLNMDMAAASSAPACHGEPGPHPIPALVVGHQPDFFVHEIARPMRVDREKLLIVVAFAMDESHEQAARFRAEHILQDARVQVVPQHLAVTHGVLAVLKQAVVAAARSSTAGFLDLVIRRVGKAQHQVAEVFAEFILFGEKLQHAHLRRRRRDHEIAIPHEDCSRHFALHRRDEADRA